MKAYPIEWALGASIPPFMFSSKSETHSSIVLLKNPLDPPVKLDLKAYVLDVLDWI
jgi:hypothetical protein